MAQPTISDLSTTPGSNADFNAVGIIGSSLLSTADDAFRMLASMLAGYSKDLAGIGQTVAGTANAVTLTVAQPWTALATGQLLAFKNTPGPNTGAVTLAVTNSVSSALGAKAIRLQGDSALVGGEMVANGVYLLRYDAAYNSAAGAWVLMNPAALPLNGGTLTGDLTIGKSSPAINLTKSASGQTAQIVSRLNAVLRWVVQIGNATSEGGANAGSDLSITAYDDSGAGLSVPLTIKRSSGLITLGAGQLQFPATQNPSSDANTMDDYQDAVSWTPAFSATGCTFSYATQTGRATKIGRIVVAPFEITLATSGNTLAGNGVSITGLPYAVENAGLTHIVPVNWGNLGASYVQVAVSLGAGSTSMTIYALTAAGASLNNVIPLANALLSATAGSTIRGILVYRTDS